MDDTGNTALSSNMLSGVLAQNSAGQNITGAVVTADPSDTNPSMDGTADPGSSSTYSRGDHVHPTDTSRAAASHSHAISDITNLQTTLNGKADDSDIPTKTSELTNDSGFLTSHQDISGKLDTNGNGSNVTVAFTQASSRTNIATGTTLATAFSRIAKWFSDLGSLAFKSTASKSDLDSSVQASLDLADSALQSYTETDPTVPSWAKASTKPTYTYSEVGAAASSHTHSNYVPTTRTVNGKALSANITLDADDVGALPDSTSIPTKTSDLTNDSGFITSVPVTSVNSKTGAVSLTYSDVGAAASSHGTHVTYSSTAPAMNGTASVGSASTVARSDHVHPSDTTKASKTTITTTTLSASGWSGSTYSGLQTTYPSASYDLEIEPNGDSCTADQYSAWGAAQLVGSATTNVLTALGTVPTVDIPIIVKYTPK